MTTKYPKGAEWRKWDLHVHTPCSICQHFGENNETTWEKYIACLEQLPKEYAVIGVNDYLFLDGYEKLIKEQSDNFRIKNLTLFPVVEFRIDKFAGVDFGNLKRINLHVIFSNSLSVEVIRSQFLNTLEQSYMLESGKPWSRAITKESVNELGASLKASIPLKELSKYGSDLSEGFNNLNVKEEKIFEALGKDCFNGKYLIAIGKTEWDELSWTDSSIATKKSIINKADLVFTAAENVDKFRKAKERLTVQGVNDLLLDCSDAHYFSDSDEKDRIGNCATWIKADPTFEGLKQVLIEPKDRVYVGECPDILGKIEVNKTKYIKELSVNQVSGYDETHGVWFKNVSIPINGELVAIIGNKGSGKSAITDIISLCSNFHNDDFSFLTTKKFREKGSRIARNFEAKVKWEDGNEYAKNLSDDVEETDVVSVKYIPQGQFERLTNEIDTAENFKKEIEKVVFSHMPEAERLGAESFNELIEKTTSSVSSSIKSLKSEIEAINTHIIELEKKMSPSYKKEIENIIKKKQDELNSLQEPEKVTNPNEDTEKKAIDDAVNIKITEIKNEIAEIELQQKEKESEKKRLITALQQLKDTKEEVIQKEIEIEKFIQEKQAIMDNYKIDVNTLISIKMDYSEISRAISTNEEGLLIVKKDLGEIVDKNSSKKSLPAQLEEKLIFLNEEKTKLDTKQRQYQDYLSKYEQWEKRRIAIIGSPESPDTLEYYNAQIKYLADKLDQDLKSKYQERRELAGKIYDDKQKTVTVYKKARARLNEIIDRNSATLNEYKISIDAALVKKNDFNDKFLGYISKNIIGTFYSKAGGEQQLKKIADEINFDQKKDVINFLDKLIDAIKVDKREIEDSAPRDIFKQVNDVEDFYNYLFSLQFLGINYQLKQGDKELQQLSPGERGALLLVFYLLLDNDTIPLIIDQPEDNLDNHSVATVLVPFIRAAKKKRQIIMVTHNPNLAVVADAEQIIHVKLEKEKKNVFSAISGSIENQEINQKIVEVLEGAMPAFNMRRDKYFDL